MGITMFLKGGLPMKCEIIIDKNTEEKVVIYAKEATKLVQEIKQLAEASHVGLLGYNGKEIVTLNPADIYCVTVIGGKVCAVCEREHLQLKERLYILEEKLPDCFLKINQSCIANTQKIERFDASISGTLKVRFKNGHTDYVSRRQLKQVKERMGIS